jgi:hypothetical protein
MIYRSIISAVAMLAILSSAAFAQWDDSWKKKYPVGAKLLASPSYNDADWREGVVTENWPGGVFKVKVPAGNGYPGGVFIISSESAVKPFGAPTNGADLPVAQGNAPAMNQGAPQQTAPQGAVAPQNQPGAPAANYDFKKNVDTNTCNHDANGFKQILLERERGKSPLQNPRLEFHTFDIGAQQTGWDPSSGMFWPDGVGRNHLRTVTPVKTKYAVYEHYTDSTKVTEMEQTFFFFKDETGECVATAYKGRVGEIKFLPKGTP